MTRTAEAPFSDETRTRRAFVSLCCTSLVAEFSVDGVLWLANRIVGHGWSRPWQGSVDGINDTGTLIDADDTERAISWVRRSGDRAGGRG